MAFLQVVTRTYKRPKGLESNQASLAAQTDGDYVQVLLPDDIGRGTRWADAQLAKVEPFANYVWPLDDDDFCPDPSFVATLKRLAAEHNDPPAFMVRIVVGRLGILPPAELWGQQPVFSQCGTSSMVARADVWRAHRAAWDCTAPQIGDYEFIASVWREHGAAIIWHDTVARSSLRLSNGLPEAV